MSSYMMKATPHNPPLVHADVKCYVHPMSMESENPREEKKEKYKEEND